MNQAGYALLGLTAIVAFLVGVLAFALMRFAAAASGAKQHLRAGGGTEAALLSNALQDAVSRLKAQEQAMSARAHASEQLSGQIVENLTAGLLVVAPDGVIEILNPMGQRLLGLSSSCVGSNFRDALAATAPLVGVIGQCQAGGKAILRRALEIPGGARSTHLGVSVSPLGDAAAPGSVICLFSDLTTVVELEAELRLKETLARLGELTAGIAHEFRNGLATIHGYSRLIDLDALPLQYQPYVHGIRQETEALGHVVTNFLNFARPEQLAFLSINLEGVVRRACDDLKHELPPGSACVVEGEFAKTLGDEVALRQVFGNLVRNAAEACHAAGVIPAISVTGRVENDQRICRVTVDDNGPGIPQAERERVFRPFVTTRSRGTGLGLAIVQKIVVIHNGRVSIGASAAGGASIRVVLPLA